jgi:hypothetical protein
MSCRYCHFLRGEGESNFLMFGTQAELLFSLVSTFSLIELLIPSDLLFQFKNIF